MKNVRPFLSGCLSFVLGRHVPMRLGYALPRFVQTRLPHVVHYNYDRRQASK